MDINEFRTDLSAEQSGVWIPIGKGFSIKVARWGNPNAKKLHEKLSADPEISRLLRASMLPEEKAEEMITQVLSEAVLLDWRGLKDKGQEIPYSKEAARAYLKIKDFRAMVERHSQTQEHFALAAVEMAAEELKKT